jgi:uncharacterized circularly permuted ATP-grasp superfamily protein
MPYRPAVLPPRQHAGRAGVDGCLPLGGVSICSAPGAGVADDKAVYTYVPEMVRFYLGEEPIVEQRADLAMRQGQMI